MASYNKPSPALHINLQPGSSLGNYRIERPLGGGGQGEVFLAKDVVLGRYVAIKVFRMESQNGQELSEARLLSTLEHPNIVRIHHVERQGSAWYLVMEYVSGGDYATKIKQGGPLSSLEALKVIAEISSALIHAHERKIIHRDIKPKNLLIGDGGVSKLADFGLAVKAWNPDLANQPVGTPAFAAPEIWRKETASAQSDLYSLGATLYFLLTGELVFPKTSVASMREAHLTLAPKLPGGLPAPLKALLLESLAKNRSERIPSAQEFYQRASAAVEQLGESAPKQLRWFTPKTKQSADEELLNALAFTTTRESLQKALAAQAPVIVLADRSGRLGDWFLRTLLEAEIDKSVGSIITKVLEPQHQGLGASVTELFSGVMRVVSVQPPERPTLYLLDILRPLRIQEVAALCDFARQETRRAVLLLRASPEISSLLLEQSKAFEEGLFAEASLSQHGEAKERELLMRWLSLATQSRLRWTEDALLLAVMSKLQFPTLLHNATMIAALLKSRFITTWCIVGAQERETAFESMEAVPVAWRTLPATWPDPDMIETLQRLRANITQG